MADNGVATQTAEVTAMQEDWALSEALLGGTRAMRSAGKKYLPQFPKEEDPAYAIRLKSSVLFPAYKRTVSTLAAKPFSKSLTISDNTPAKLREWLEDADLQGCNFHSFSSEVFQLAMGYGLAGILVEYPTVEREPDAPPLSQAQEESMGLRPYLVRIQPKQLIGWRVTRVLGVWKLTQLRFMECKSEDSGPYGQVEVEQVRVIEPTRWETHRKNAKGEWELYRFGVNTLGEVPFVPVYGERCGFMVGKPPLLEVAHLNVAHWQSASDQQNILHVARVPILAAIGVDDDYSLVVGTQSATRIPMGGDLKFVEHSGAAIGAGNQDLKDLEERMRQSGAELLVIKPGQVTATQINTENSVGMCALQEMGETFEDALNAVIALMSKWAKLGDAGSVALYKDFGAATLAEASSKLIFDMNMAGKLSDETLHSELQRRGILAPDNHWVDEKQRISDQGPAGAREPGGDDQ